MKGIGGHQSHKMQKDEWLTPPDITKALGPFDLDPCSPINPPWRIADQTYNVNDDGLSQDWDGFVWCNPPYGAMANAWLDKLARHGNGIALIFARTETEMFFDHAWRSARSLFFIEGRLYFHHVNGSRAKTNSGAPSVLLAYGEEADNRIRACGLAGVYVSGWEVLSGKRAGEIVDDLEDIL